MLFFCANSFLCSKLESIPICFNASTIEFPLYDEFSKYPVSLYPSSYTPSLFGIPLISLTFKSFPLIPSFLIQ